MEGGGIETSAELVGHSDNGQEQRVGGPRELTNPKLYWYLLASDFQLCDLLQPTVKTLRLKPRKLQSERCTKIYSSRQKQTQN